MPIFFNQRGNPNSKRMGDALAGEKMGSSDTGRDNPDQADMIDDNPEGEAAMESLTEPIDPPTTPRKATADDPLIPKTFFPDD